MEMFLLDSPVPFHHIECACGWQVASRFGSQISESKQVSSFFSDDESSRHHTGILGLELEPMGWLPRGKKLLQVGGVEGSSIEYVNKVMSLLFNMLSRLVITFLLRSKHHFISWLHAGESPLLSRSGGEKGLRGSGAGTLGVPLGGKKMLTP